MVSAYQLACGHVQRRETATLQTTLWHEYGVYHVRTHEFGGRGRLAWETFQTLREARRKMSRQHREYKGGAK